MRGRVRGIAKEGDGTNVHYPGARTSKKSMALVGAEKRQHLSTVNNWYSGERERGGERDLKRRRPHGILDNVILARGCKGVFLGTLP